MNQYVIKLLKIMCLNVLCFVSFFLIVSFTCCAGDLSKSVLPGAFNTQLSQGGQRQEDFFDEKTIDTKHKELIAQFNALEEAIVKKHNNLYNLQEKIQRNVDHLRSRLPRESFARRELYTLITTVSDPKIYAIFIKDPQNKKILKTALEEISKFKDQKYFMSGLGEFEIIDTGSTSQAKESLLASAIQMESPLKKLKEIVEQIQDRITVKSDITKQIEFIEKWPDSAKNEKIAALQLLGAYYLDRASSVKQGGDRTTKFTQVTLIANALRTLGFNMPFVREQSIKKDIVKFYKIYNVGFISGKELTTFMEQGNGNLFDGFCMQLKLLRKKLKRYKEYSAEEKKGKQQEVRNLFQRYRGTVGICACLNLHFETLETKKTISEIDQVIQLLDEQIKQHKEKSLLSEQLSPLLTLESTRVEEFRGSQDNASNNTSTTIETTAADPIPMLNTIPTISITSPATSSTPQMSLSEQLSPLLTFESPIAKKSSELQNNADDTDTVKTTTDPIPTLKTEAPILTTSPVTSSISAPATQPNTGSTPISSASTGWRSWFSTPVRWVSDAWSGLKSGFVFIWKFFGVGV